ncbi:hypothetical protein IWX49DRAFT_576389 [Phyllosticta citricarpa]
MERWENVELDTVLLLLLLLLSCVVLCFSLSPSLSISLYVRASSHVTSVLSLPWPPTCSNLSQPVESKATNA